jgi:glycosyltransferase involved in cell wall biosynthesis
VHDYLNQHGGAERLLESLVELAPRAPIYTSIYDPETMPSFYRHYDVRTSWLNHLPGAGNSHQWLLPLYPAAFRTLRLPACDLVFSSSSAFAKMVRPPAGAVHVCYAHSPMRFAWDFPNYAEREQLPGPIRRGLEPMMRWLRREDRLTSASVDYFIANSTAVRDRIRAFWRRDAVVIHPPVDVERFAPVPADQIGDYFLIVSRLVPYKRLDVAVDAFNVLGLPLRIVGDGRDRQALRRRAAANIRFMGRLSDEGLKREYAHCRAAVFISEDDFGIAQVEAQASGRPVIALAAGGALDSVLPDETGVFIQERTVEGLLQAVRRFEELEFQPVRLVNHARQFSRERFQAEIVEFVERVMAERGRAGGAWN